jgi:predicted nucleic acid-binding protein
VVPLLESRPAFDAAAAAIWDELMGSGDAAGRQLPIIDAQIAAVALANGLRVVTRNVRDFAPMRVATVDPWDETLLISRHYPRHAMRHSGRARRSPA